MKRSIRFAPLALVLLAGAHADARDLRPNINRYFQAPAARVPAGSPAAQTGFVASFDSKRGVPTFFWADPAAPPPPSSSLTTPTIEERAFSFVAQNAKLYRLSPAALDAAYVREV